MIIKVYFLDSSSRAESVETWFERLRAAEKELSQLITNMMSSSVLLDFYEFSAFMEVIAGTGYGTRYIMAVY